MGRTLQRFQAEQKKEQNNKPFIYKVSDAGEFTGDILEGAAKGVSSTIFNLAKLGQKISTPLQRAARLTPMDIGEKDTTFPGLKPNNTPEEIGFLSEQFGEFFIPVGGAGKGGVVLSKVAPRIASKPGAIGSTARGTARILGEAAEFTGKTAIQSGGDAKETKDAAIISVVAPVAMKGAGVGVKLASRLFGSFSTNVAGTVSGKGGEVIKTAFKRPEEARKGISGGVVVAKETAEQARKKIGDLSKANNMLYERKLGMIEDTYKTISKKKEFLLYRVPEEGVEPTFVTLSGKGIKASLTKSLRKFNVLIDPKKKNFDFSESPLDRSEEKLLKEVFDVVNDWDNYTPSGLNRLAIKVGNYRKPGQTSKQFNSIIDASKRNIRTYVGKRVPEIKELNQYYAERADFLEGVSSVLRASTPGTEGVNKTFSAISGLFNTNKELARALVQQLEGDAAGKSIDILGREAGRQLGQATSRSTASIGSLATGAIQSLLPPSAIGKAAIGAGIASKKIAPIVDALERLQPKERVIVYKAIQELLSTTDDTTR